MRRRTDEARARTTDLQASASSRQSDQHPQAPRQRPCDSTMSPPWPRTMSRAMVRPRPTPPVSGCARRRAGRTGGRPPRAVGRGAGAVVVHGDLDWPRRRDARSETGLPHGVPDQVGEAAPDGVRPQRKSTGAGRRARSRVPSRARRDDVLAATRRGRPAGRLARPRRGRRRDSPRPSLHLGHVGLRSAIAGSFRRISISSASFMRVSGVRRSWRPASISVRWRSGAGCGRASG